MKRLILIFAVMLCVAVAFAQKFSYRFNHTPLADALTQIAEQHPDLHINFIYNELDKYPVTVTIHTDDAYAALRQLIGLNPVSVIRSSGRYYVEALQHGKFTYRGRAVGSDNEPVAAATVMLLSPADSTVITYGVADADGRFSIPCDRLGVIAKLSCMGYATTYRRCPDFDLGTVIMPVLPIILNPLTKQPDYTVYESDKNIYLPTSRQRNSSNDATDLLRRMAIPQLVINPGDNNVKDVFGNYVAVFINSHEAQPDELKGMNMADVRRIEYLEFPTDPRFKGKERVVNFIVREYEYGGYTKVSESLKTLNGLFNNTDIFSRFTYKRMSYDLYAGSDNQNFKHNGTDNTAVYRLEKEGKPVQVTRKQKVNGRKVGGGLHICAEFRKFAT